MIHADRNHLEMFVEIARAGSIRRAALSRGVTASAISHALASLESQLGIRLFNRTTRKLSLTPAGEMLFHDLSESFLAIRESLERIEDYRSLPAGRLRVTALRDATTLLLAPRLPSFLERYPNIEVEVSVDDRFVDAVAEGFDLGIRYGGTVPEGMIAARLSPQLDWVVVGAPAYFERYGRPIQPTDLMQHRCIRIRTGSGRVLAWELGEGSSMQSFDVPGVLTLGDTELSLAMTRAGIGLFYCLRERVQEDINAGNLEVTLDEWSSPGEGFYAYYASRKQIPRALRLFLDFLRQR